MQPKWYKRLQILLIICLIYCISAILDIMVSMKYETDFNDPCFSTITESNLCSMLMRYKVVMGVVAAAFLLSIALKNKLVKG